MLLDFILHPAKRARQKLSTEVITDKHHEARSSKPITPAFPTLSKSAPILVLLSFMAVTGLILSACKKEHPAKQYEGAYQGIYRKTDYKSATREYEVVVDSNATAIVSGINKGNITVTVQSAFFPSRTTFTSRFTSSHQFSSRQSAAHAIQTIGLMGSFSGDTLRLVNETRYNGILHYSLELVATRR